MLHLLVLSDENIYNFKFLDVMQLKIQPLIQDDWGYIQKDL
jgi:hypothetical protein